MLRQPCFSWFCPNYGPGSNGLRSDLSLNDIIDSAIIAENMGFDAILTPADSNSYDPWMLSMQIISKTQKIRPIIALRPGFIAPVYTARMIATLQQLSGGRADFNIVTGGSTLELAKEGCRLSHEERYRRTYEYMEVISNLLKETKPYSFNGQFYNITNATLFPKIPDLIHPKFYIAGASADAVKVAKSFGDFYLMWAQPIESTKQQLLQFEQHDKVLDYSLRVNIIVRKNKQEAIEAANATIQDRSNSRRLIELVNIHSDSVGQKKMMALALEGGVHDTCLWSNISVGKTGSVPFLVGSTEEVRNSLKRYLELGFSNFILASTDTGSEIGYISEEIVSYFHNCL
ncbi:LLM class flavin-dependent oxidoreductase [Paenibacillus pinisoli]|uniref:LLM class flavin-dependent oxidoreductase n=1 Tax=Paenibacillus pinisoli TaxID=1276110 RepID=A0A3A6PFA4_9BACL|nr:LLM class flavin-dependent oxidoreductase [Paenibacillus pinisoli]RJX37528.1 LLM class flavin-dependent oxidoreductase [Paenibacillus pinisoli]